MNSSEPCTARKKSPIVIEGRAAGATLPRHEALDLLIDYRGRAIRPGRRSLARSVSQLGFIHIQIIASVAIVTLQPELVLPLTMVGAMDEIAHLQPERTIVVVADANRASGDFSGHMPALRMIEGLVRETAAGAPWDSPTPAAHPS